MVPTYEQLTAIVGRKPKKDNANSVIVSLEKYGRKTGLDRPHILAQYLAQLLQENGGFNYDREIWGNTPAQQRYDVGKKAIELGNTPEADGDGKKFSGKGPIQLTGRGNITRFYNWCVKAGMNPPDFRKDPDLINTDPWEGLSAIWYWDVGNPTGKSLNRYADENNIMQITKKVNGGLTHFEQRVKFYVRAALVFLGYAATDVKGFQSRNGLLIDGDPGPLTLSALHKALAAMAHIDVAAAPVVETINTTTTVTQEVEVPVPVVPKDADKTGGNWLSGIIAFVTTNVGSFFTQDFNTKILILVVSALAIGFMLWKGQVVAQRIKKIVAEIGS